MNTRWRRAAYSAAQVQTRYILGGSRASARHRDDGRRRGQMKNMVRLSSGTSSSYGNGWELRPCTSVDGQVRPGIARTKGECFLACLPATSTTLDSSAYRQSRHGGGIQ